MSGNRIVVVGPTTIWGAMRSPGTPARPWTRPERSRERLSRSCNKFATPSQNKAHERPLATAVKSFRAKCSRRGRALSQKVWPFQDTRSDKSCGCTWSLRYTDLRSSRAPDMHQQTHMTGRSRRGSTARRHSRWLRAEQTG